MHQELKKVDAIFILGSYDLRVADRASELYFQGLGKYIICSGGFGLVPEFKKAEAEVFADVLLANGVPVEKIIIENKSLNTGQNILFVKKLLEEKGLHFNSFILVQKPYVERRAYAAFLKQWPGPICKVTSPQIAYEDYSTDEKFKDRFINMMVGDLQRIKEYPAKGFQIPQDIPAEVWNAYEKLVELGYTKYLVIN